MNLPKLADIDVSGKRALVRLDLDTPEGDDSRLKAATKTLDYLKSKNSQIIVIGHKGRPEGKVDESLSTKLLQPYFDKWRARVEENLRFDPGEENNNEQFAMNLASLGDIYINEAFAVSHRAHASIVSLPKLLPHAAVFRFIEEVEHLERQFQKPVVILISGIKEDKIEMVKKLAKVYDKVLVGGRLPEHFGDGALESVRTQNGNMVIGNLTMDKEDITLNTIERFKKEIEKAGTIILAGVLGKYEDKGHIQGTTEIFEAVAKSSAYKIAGGGDTESAISQLAISHKFDWISVGGGAMIEFLINKTLPGIEALTP